MTINKLLWNKYTISWYLLDMGSSFTGVIGMLYFSQWVVIDNHVSEAWYTAPTIIATVLLLFCSTHLGWFGDKFGAHFKNLKKFTILTLVFMLGVILSGYFLGPIGVWAALLFFFLYSFTYQMVLVPYVSFIKSLVPEALYGKLSGFGLAFGQVGSVIGVLIALPILSSGGFSGQPRLDALFAMLILYALCTIPALLLLKHAAPAPQPDIPHQKMRESIKNSYRTAKRYPGVLPLLLSFYLFSDAIMTAILYFSLFLEKVLHVNDTIKSYMYLVVTLGFSVGALISGWLSDRYGRKRILIASLLPNAIAIYLVAIVTDIQIAFVLYTFLGMTIGSVFSASRSYLSSLIPLGSQGTIFGLYTFSEKAASIVGPLIWLLILAIIPGTLGYRVGMCVLATCTLGSLIPLLWKKRAVAQSI
jgi:UMF1 family MFS transporter